MEPGTFSLLSFSIYTNPLSNERLPIGSGSPINVDAAVLEKWRQLLIQQILLAGSRTAIVLNDILESSAAPGLRSVIVVYRNSLSSTSV